AAGLQKVREEPVTVNRWLRGEASAEIVSPVETALHVAALGGSIGGNVTAEIVEAHNAEELKALGDRAKGRIVFISQKMERTRTGEGYGKTVPLRGNGAVEAAKHGAVAAIIRSVGTGAYQLPHTGATRYEEGVPKIPFAAISAEDAELLERLLAAGPVKLHLQMSAKWDEQPVASANVVGELPGRVKPDEVVVIGAHLD